MVLNKEALPFTPRPTSLFLSFSTIFIVVVPGKVVEWLECLARGGAGGGPILLLHSPCPVGAGGPVAIAAQVLPPQQLVQILRAGAGAGQQRGVNTQAALQQ